MTSSVRPNPLSQFSSVNYMLSLYMLTPEAMNYFSKFGVLPPNSGNESYITVVSTGGIDNEGELRGLTFDEQIKKGNTGLDLHIDNLFIETYLLAQDRQRTASVSTTFTFDVIEPLGFTFLTKLSKASNTLNELSNLSLNDGKDASPSLYQQHYILGVKFHGYDDTGAMVTAKDLGETVSGVSDEYSLYERLFPLIISRVNFKLNGRQTTYSFEAAMLHFQASYGIKRGIITKQTTFSGSTVGEVIGDKNSLSSTLLGSLNKAQEDQLTQGEISKKQIYDIEWVTNDKVDSSPIKQSELIIDAEYNDKLSKTSDASKTKESTVKISVAAENINKTEKVIDVAAGTSIVSVIDQIIAKSKFISDKLTMTTNDKPENEQAPSSGGKFSWFSINPIVTIEGRDNKTFDWVYKITYQIVPYSVSYVRSSYIKEKSKYTGPVKRYSYLFTGENSEIINFEMEYNNLFYVIEVPGIKKSKGSTSNTSKVPRSTSGGSSDNSVNTNHNRGGTILENVRASLYNPADQSIVTMKILGDPDFLMDSLGTFISEHEGDEIFSKNGTIKPYSGQVYAEIDFKVAEDYDMSTGLMDVTSNSVKFYDKDVPNAQGIVYRINSVKSYFNRGRFEQDLEMFMVDPEELIADTATKADEGKTASASAASDESSERESEQKEQGVISSVGTPMTAGATASTDPRSLTYKPDVNTNYDSRWSRQDGGFAKNTNTPEAKPPNVSNDDAKPGSGSKRTYETPLDRTYRQQAEERQASAWRSWSRDMTYAQDTQNVTDILTRANMKK
jgi:hypothetical protein